MAIFIPHVSEIIWKFVFLEFVYDLSATSPMTILNYHLTFFYNKKAKVIKHGNILPIRVQTESLSGTLNEIPLLLTHAQRVVLVPNGIPSVSE